MNRMLYRFGIYGYVSTLIGIIGFFSMSSLGYSVYNFIFVAPLLLGIFLLVYKNSGLYHYAKNVIIMLDFVYIIGLIFIAATPLPWKISIVLVAAIGALASFTLIKFTFNSGR